MNYPFILSEQEKHELLQRPITESYTAFTEYQLDIRKGIASRFCESMVDSQEMPELIKNVYKTVKMDKFYIVDDVPKRLYGLATDSQGMVVGMTAGINLMTGAPYKTNDKLGDLVTVHNWTVEQLEIFKNMSIGGIFTDPMGFILLFEN